MKKIETIWHYLTVQALERKIFRHTQQDIARHLGYSLSTVNHAVENPAHIGALRKEAKSFSLADFDKLLYYWASVRNLRKDILYQTYVASTIPEIEGLMIPNVIFACYTAAKRRTREPPADYAAVHVYIKNNDLPRLKSRFPKNSGAPNLIALAEPPGMDLYGPLTTLPQTFVDIWNLPDWYSKDFTDTLAETMHGLLS